MMDLISWQHSHTREDTLPNTQLLHPLTKGLHVLMSNPGPSVFMTQATLSDMCSAITITVVGKVCQSKMGREREWLVTSRVGQVLAFRYALLQQVHQNRPRFCLHSPRHELRTGQLADTHQALHCCLNQGWPIILHPAKCACRHIKKTEGIRGKASRCLDE